MRLAKLILGLLKSLSNWVWGASGRHDPLFVKPMWEPNCDFIIVIQNKYIVSSLGEDLGGWYISILIMTGHVQQFDFIQK